MSHYIAIESTSRAQSCQVLDLLEARLLELGLTVCRMEYPLLPVADAIRMPPSEALDLVLSNLECFIWMLETAAIPSMVDGGVVLCDGAGLNEIALFDCPDKRQIVIDAMKGLSTFPQRMVVLPPPLIDGIGRAVFSSNRMKRALWDLKVAMGIAWPDQDMRWRIDSEQTDPESQVDQIVSDVTSDLFFAPQSPISASA